MSNGTITIKTVRINNVPQMVEVTSGTDYAGREFCGEYYVTPAYSAPGWVINQYAYAPGGFPLVRIAARPNVAPRKYKHFNGQRRRGWHTKREAEAVLKALQEQHGL